ncbi:hypothetical protein ml_479 [Mollivirus sibericum]|uniref:hypothetical protein n=1 Tax=Mollivirus sibericum TaxID=1678078 RepID=UPI0006B2E407|nr:hypothetical protein ml_479 [Mollivirus sibericum]ALD62281.1 hypothetical protein ml_479 [Mollivirus sibericum]
MEDDLEQDLDASFVERPERRTRRRLVKTREAAKSRETKEILEKIRRVLRIATIGEDDAVIWCGLHTMGTWRLGEGACVWIRPSAGVSVHVSMMNSSLAKTFDHLEKGWNIEAIAAAWPKTRRRPMMDRECHSLAMVDYRVSYIARWLDDMKAVADAEHDENSTHITMPGGARWQFIYKTPCFSSDIRRRLQRWCDVEETAFLRTATYVPHGSQGVTMRDCNDRLIHCLFLSTLDEVRLELREIDKALVGLKCYHSEPDTMDSPCLSFPKTQRL